jgi:hypothetical protein
MKRYADLAVIVAAGWLAAASVRADGPREIRKLLPLDADGSLSVETYKGSITVTTAPGGDASIEARIVPDGDDEASLRRAAETNVKIEGGGKSVSVRTDDSGARHRGWFGSDEGSQPMVHYTIRMPATAHLWIEDYKSTTRVSGLASDLRIKTYKGSVDVVRQNGGVELETYKGEISIAFEALMKPVTLETYKGDIQLRIPTSAHFEVDADTGRHGDFATEFEMTTRTGGSRGRAHGIVNGGGARISFETDKGSLRLVKQ